MAGGQSIKKSSNPIVQHVIKIKYINSRLTFIADKYFTYLQVICLPGVNDTTSTKENTIPIP